MQITQGLILTSHFYDSHSGLRLEYYVSDGHESFKLIFTGEKVVFFIPKNAIFNPNVHFERKSKALKNFKNIEVDTIYLDRYQDLGVVRDYCERNSIPTFELDILPTERFLMERFINGLVEFVGDITEQNGVKVLLNPKVRAGKNIPHISILSLDIETGVSGDLYSIGLHYKGQDGEKKCVLMKNNESKKVDEILSYYASEKEILINFLNLVKSWDPDLITGWHVIGFDLKFLEDKFKFYNLDFSLGRMDSKLSIVEKKGSGFYTDMAGRVVLDGPVILRSAFYQFKDFKLDTVASEVLGKNKDIASDDQKVLEIERRFKEDKPALAKYNLLDCTLVLEIYEKLKIVDLLLKRVCISGMLLDRMALSTAAFDHVYLPLLHRKGYVAPNRIDIIRDDASTGGMVLEPTAGLHKNVAVFDFKSLYPSIIMTFKIDPYSLVQKDIDTVKTPKGYEFSKTESILPEIIKNLMQTRQMAKNENNSNLSQAVKILMNSFYGVMGSSRCRFYHADLPTAITTSGHWILEKSIEYFSNRDHKVIYGDTDSIFIKLGDDISRQYCHELASGLNQFIQKLLKDEYKVDSYLECEYEKTFDQLFFASTRSGEGAAKKKYTGIIDYKLEFKGMEFVRSDWTELAKKFQKSIFEKFFMGEELETFIKDTIQSLENGEFDKDLVYTKRLTKDPREYVKNIPPHVRAALQIDHKGPYRLKEVSYIMTKDGPCPIQMNRSDFDYSHYIDKQLRPIANDILNTIGKDFDSITSGEQLSLF